MRRTYHPVIEINNSRIIENESNDPHRSFYAKQQQFPYTKLDDSPNEEYKDKINFFQEKINAVVSVPKSKSKDMIRGKRTKSQISLSLNDKYNRTISVSNGRDPLNHNTKSLNEKLSPNSYTLPLHFFEQQNRRAGPPKSASDKPTNIKESTKPSRPYLETNARQASQFIELKTSGSRNFSNKSFDSERINSVNNGDLKGKEELTIIPENKRKIAFFEKMIINSSNRYSNSIKKNTQESLGKVQTECNTQYADKKQETNQVSQIDSKKEDIKYTFPSANRSLESHKDQSNSSVKQENRRRKNVSEVSKSANKTVKDPKLQSNVGSSERVQKVPEFNSKHESKKIYEISNRLSSEEKSKNSTSNYTPSDYDKNDPLDGVPTSKSELDTFKKSLSKTLMGNINAGRSKSSRLKLDKQNLDSRPEKHNNKEREKNGSANSKNLENDMASDARKTQFQTTLLRDIKSEIEDEKRDHFVNIPEPDY